jgi:ribosomal protein S18 acetylase RimI-like enzyme
MVARDPNRKARPEREVTIGHVRDDQFAAVLQLWQEAGVTPPSASDSIEGLSRLAQTPSGLLLVATIDQRVVGSVIGGWDGWRGNIYRLAVTPAYRRTGVARRLVAEIGNALFAMGAETLSARVEREHQWAIDFWASVRDLGYEPDSRFARYIAKRSDGLSVNLSYSKTKRRDGDEG